LPLVLLEIDHYLTPQPPLQAGEGESMSQL
jgi:hypothetical protein